MLIFILSKNQCVIKLILCIFFFFFFEEKWDFLLFFNVCVFKGCGFFEPKIAKVKGWGLYKKQ